VVQGERWLVPTSHLRSNISRLSPRLPSLFHRLRHSTLLPPVGLPSTTLPYIHLNLIVHLIHVPQITDLRNHHCHYLAEYTFVPLASPSITLPSLTHLYSSCTSYNCNLYIFPPGKWPTSLPPLLSHPLLSQSCNPTGTASSRSASRLSG
jgi:hypothetical protein